MSIRFEGRISLFIKKKSKEQQTLIFASLASREVIQDMKENQPKYPRKEKIKTQIYPVTFHAVKNSLQPLAELQQ